MHSLPTICLHTVPGGAGLTVGENELAPPGPTCFSVGDGVADGAVEEGVVVVDGDSLALELQPALSAPIPTMAAPPTRRAIWRVNRPDFMMCPHLSH